MEGPQLRVQGGRDPGFGRGLGDRLAPLARPPQPLAALEPSLELFDANPGVNAFAIFDEQGGEDGTRLVGLEVGHQALRRRVRSALERAYDRAERGVTEVVRLVEQRQEERAGLNRVEQERHEIAFDWRRGRRWARLRVRRRRAQRGLQPLRLDPELSRINPELGRGLARERRRGDRKSTRLNSSHSQISYAVFCLKKKKRHTRTK